MLIEEFYDRWAAAERDADVTALHALIDAEFCGVGPLGFTLDKHAWLQRHRDGDLRYEAFSLDEVATRRPSTDVAVLTARQNAIGTYRGVPTPPALRATIVLTGADDRWKLQTLHLSFIAGTPGAPPLPGAAAAEAAR